jgi:hypothetical protein
MEDEFLVTTIIAKAISSTVVESSSTAIDISSEQAVGIATAVMAALSKAGLTIAPSSAAADPR